MAKTSNNWLDRAVVAHIFNSGLEVWLYDEASRQAIVERGGIVTALADGKLFADGILAAYSLYQDNEVRVAVMVGPPPALEELTGAAWLDPQVTFLRLPSGELCIESNDASRIGPDEPTHEGVRVAVPSGDYRVTLYRVDHEALNRMERQWTGPQEVIVLTPGGVPADLAGEILPFKHRRDGSWIGQYTIDGSTFMGLAWFDDSLGTVKVNLDARAGAVRNAPVASAPASSSTV